jgi:hypothetical protein
LPYKFQGSLTAEVFANSHFKQCIGPDGGTLVLMGKMGIGKTTTVVGLLNEIDKGNPSNPCHGRASDGQIPSSKEGHNGEERNRPKNKVVVASIFFSSDSKVKERYKADLVLMSIANQLANALGGKHHLRQMYERHPNVRPPCDSITSTIKKVIQGVENCCIFLDALDENDLEEVQRLMKEIGNIQRDCHIGVVITHRDSVTFEFSQWLSHICELPIEAKENDIIGYGQEYILQLAENPQEDYDWVQNQDLCNKAASTIAESSAGM